METTINNLKAISAARIRLKDLHTHEDGEGENLAWSCIVFLKGMNRPWFRRHLQAS